MKRSYILFALAGACAVTLPSRALAQDPAEPPGPDTVYYTPEKGAVTFAHGKHAKAAECKSCHHESKAEKPLESPRQKCSACHTTPPTEPVKTSRKDAFHDTVNKEGMCLTCHQKEAEAGKVAPTACADCHIKAEPAKQRR